MRILLILYVVIGLTYEKNETIFEFGSGMYFSLSAWAQETVAVNTGDLISPEVRIKL